MHPKLKIILVMPLLLASCGLLSKNKANKDSFPVYGNYCGINYPKKGENPVPIDKTDLSCKKHDQCYEAMGYFNKKCDKDLIKNLNSVTPKTEFEKIAKETIILYFKNSPKIN